MFLLLYLLLDILKDVFPLVKSRLPPPPPLSNLFISLFVNYLENMLADHFLRKDSDRLDEFLDFTTLLDLVVDSHKTDQADEPDYFYRSENEEGEATLCRLCRF